MSATPQPPEAPAAQAPKKKGVPVWLIVMGALAACLGILVLVVVSVGFYVVTHSEDLKQEAREIRERGTAFGRAHEQRECVQDVLGRLDTSDFVQMIQERRYLDACLKAARPTEGFCAEVPPEAKILSSVVWRQEACAGHGKPDNEECARMMGEIQQFCHPRADRPDGDSAKPAP